MRPIRRLARACSLMAPFLGLLLPAGAGAFSRDTHYYYTFAAALETCFDWPEAHLVASANRRLDGQKATKAEPNITKKFAKINWHAFGHDRQRLVELWYRALDETDPTIRLIRFGQFLHFLQDWESHADFPTGMGHARASFVGNDPDSWARAVDRTVRMLLSTGDHTTRFCAAIGRPLGGHDRPEKALVEIARAFAAEGVLEDVVRASSPKWKARRTGGFTPKGRRILSQNGDRIELFIERRIKPLPDKNVPPDFAAYPEGQGLPRPLDLEYDRDGNLLSDPAELAEAGTRGDPADEVGSDAVLRIDHAEPTANGWEVRLEVANQGQVELPPARLEVAVLDPIAEQQLGSVERRFGPVKPGREVRLEFLVPVSSPAETVMIGASLDSTDLEGEDNEAWYMTRSDEEELEDDLEEIWKGWRAGKPFAAEDLDPVDTPLVWMAGGDELCVVVWARLDAGDPTDELASPDCSLAGPGGETVALASRPLLRSDVWSITVLGREQEPAQKAWLCFDAAADLCTADGVAFDPSELRIGVGALGVRIIESVPLDESLEQRLRGLCETP